MSRIRSKDTGIERIAFSFLRRRGIHFQRHYARVPGKPDIALPSKRRAVFINGDFWHGYRFRLWKDRLPSAYWRDKIESNMARDRRNYSALRRNGWRLLRIWGHEMIRNSEKACEKIEKFLTE